MTGCEQEKNIFCSFTSAGVRGTSYPFLTQFQQFLFSSNERAINALTLQMTTQDYAPSGQSVELAVSRQSLLYGSPRAFPLSLSIASNGQWIRPLAPKCHCLAWFAYLNNACCETSFSSPRQYKCFLAQSHCNAASLLAARTASFLVT